MDPEQLREFEEQMRTLTDLMSQQNSVMAAQMKAQQDYIRSMKQATTASKDAAEADDDQADSSAKLTKLQEAEAKAKEEAIKVEQNYKSALNNSVGAVQGFASALVSSTEGVGKYGNALSSAGDAAWDVGKNFGVVGKIIGGTVNVLTKLGADALQLTDNITQLRDETVKFTGALPVSAGELGELAKQARYSLADMAKLQKATASVGTGLTSLGATAGQGAVKFMEVAAVSDDVRRKFGKMGISQESLTDLQAKYMKQQSLAGNSMELQRKSTEQLRKESLAYAENMTRLSALTGKSADQIQQEQEVVKSQFEEQMKIRQENAKIQELKALGTEESLAEAKRIQKERDNRTTMLDKLTASMGPEMAAQFGRVMRTGAFDKFSAGLAAMGVNAQDLAKQVKEAPDPNKLATETFDKYDKAVTTRAVQLGQAGQYLTDDAKKAMGLNDEYMLRSNRVFGKTEEERIAAYEADKKAREESKEALDNNIEAMRSLERETKAAYQSVLEAVNPMNLSFNGAALASAALAAAATAAALALGKMAMGKIGGGPSAPSKPGKPAATPRARDARGRFIKAPPPKPQSWLSKMTKPLSGFASKAGSVARGAGRFVPGLGQVLMVGGAAYGAYQGASNAEKTLGIEGRKATTGEKFAAGAGGALSALTFGLLSAETAGKGIMSMAERFKKQESEAKKATGTGLGAQQAQAKEQETARKKHEETVAAQKKNAEATTGATSATILSTEAVDKNIEQLDKMRETTEVNSKTEKQALDKFIFNLDQASLGLRSLNNAMTILSQTLSSISFGGGTGGTGGPAGDMGEDLGSMAAQFESGSEGTSAVGHDSTGGTSYGKYQIASNTGTMDLFMKHLQKTNPEAFERLSKAGPAKAGKDGAFAQEWKKLAKEGKLQGSEHEFIKATHFDVGVEKIKDKKLQEMIKGSKALQEVMWSTSVQHGGGGAGSIFNKAYKEGMDEQALIKEIYAQRATRFGSSTPQVRASVQDRFRKEQQLALGMVGRPGMAGGGIMMASGKLEDVLKFTSPSGEMSDFQGLNPGMQRAVFNAATEYMKATGNKLQINSAKRDPEDQERLYNETVRAGRPGKGPGGMLVARPGSSPHESGNAIDIQQYTDRMAVQILGKHGLHQKYGSKDPVHFELMARDGGIFDGPQKGYKAELHGTELVAPLLKDSILMKLAQTPAKVSQIEEMFGNMSKDMSLVKTDLGGKTLDPNTMLADMMKRKTEMEQKVTALASAKPETIATPLSKPEDKAMSMNAELMQMLSGKLDTVISVLESGNDVSSKILKSSRV
jgi:hypothetical protein